MCVFVLAYRYYSAFISAKVLALSPQNETPAIKLNDGHDYHPTNKWVLFGHHFAAIAGAGPLIGPVLVIFIVADTSIKWISEIKTNKKETATNEKEVAMELDI